MSFFEFDRWQHPNRRPPAEQSAIDVFEQTTGIKLPTDYVEFLLHTNGGEGPVGANAYAALWRIEELATLNDEYEVGRYAPGLLLFGSDGGGEAFAFDLSTPELPVVSVPFVGMGREAIRPLAPTFRAFLDVLYELE